MRRTCCTTSCEVMPAGLSTSSNPSTDEVPVPERSVVFSSLRCGSVLPLHVRQQRLDAGRARDRVVFLELDLRRHAKPERLRNAGAKMRRNAIEPVERRLLLGLAPQHAHVDACVPEIGADIGACHSHETDDPWILCRFCEEARDLDADRFGDAVRPTGVTQTHPPLKSVSARPAPCDSTR